MYGQSAAVGWLGYSAGKEIAEACGAQKGTAELIGLAVGECTCTLAAGLTSDPVGFVLGTGLLMARAAGVFGEAEAAVGMAISLASALLGLAGSRDET
jgi:hypothetical protein